MMREAWFIGALACTLGAGNSSGPIQLLIGGVALLCWAGFIVTMFYGGEK